MRYRQHSDDDPGIGREAVKFLHRPQEKMQVALEKSIQILLLHFGKGHTFIPSGIVVIGSG